MKTDSRKKGLTFGEFISRVYKTCGKRKAQAIVMHAVNEHLLQFRRHQRFLIS
jgi:hypothetical protein